MFPTAAFRARVADLVTPWGLVTAALLGAILVDIAARPLAVNHDAAACLDVARRLLDHARLYIDVIDTNPPLVYYLHTIPVAIAAAIGVHVVPTFSVVVWILTAH